MTRGFSANLDLLRSIAVLLVLAQHLLQRFGVKQLAWVDTSCLGFFGVLLFFVHTTLVLMLSLERHRGAGFFRQFYIRRLFRIYPLAILAVVAAVSLRLDSGLNGIPGLSHAGFPGKRELVGNLLLVQNLVHTRSIVNVLWSLPFELQMYLFLPLLYLVCRRGRPVELLSLWLLSVPMAWKFSLLQFGPCFLPGAIAYTLAGRGPRLPSYLWPVFLMLLLAVFTFSPHLYTGWVLCLCLGLCIPLFHEVTQTGIRFLAGKIALYSYGIYVSHQFCIWFATSVLASWPAWAKGLVLIGSIAALPIPLYHLIEKPFIEWGRRSALRFGPGPQVRADKSVRAR